MQQNPHGKVVRRTRHRSASGSANGIIAFVLLVAIILTEVIIAMLFSLTLFELVIIGLVLIIAYLFLLLVLLRPRRVHEVHRTVIEKPRQQPPIQQSVQTAPPLTKPATTPKPKKATSAKKPVRAKTVKPPVKQHNYVGSKETKKYHSKNCRLAKSIKKSHAVKNTRAYFKDKKFSPCRICRPNLK